MSRTDVTRSQLLDMIRARPYRAFALNLETGDRVVIEHPENLAFDPTDSGRDEFMALAPKLRRLGTLSAITSIAVLDSGELPG